MKFKSFISLCALLLILSPIALSQSKDTGAIVGTVMDEEKTPLPGVTVTLTSPKLMGARTTITGAAGAYRFPALPPGTYAVKAELQGFATVIRENIRVHTTIRLTVDLSMKIGTVEEEITVIAVSPTVDIKSSETASVTLSDELLRNVPYSQFTDAIVNLAPGVWGDVAYGGMSGTGISYQFDGIDISDPEGGTSWVFLDHNILEEAKIMGIGLPAEYGAFSGVIFNLVTKSGGNEFSGHFEFDFQGKIEDWPKGLWGTENNKAYIDDFPKLTSPLLKLMDANVHLGGPIKKDKIWFYAGAQFYRNWSYPTGFPEAIDYKQPRAFLKITAQLTPSTNLSTFFEYDAYNGINRDGAADVSPEATVTQDSPDYVGNFSLTHVLSPTTFIDLKASFFHGYYYLDPETGMDVNAHWDENDMMLYESSGYFGYYDRDRFQANASVTHYAEDFMQGDHDFKFGVEIEHGRVRNRSGNTGTNAMYYIDLVGYGYYGYYYTGNYLAFQYEGYDTNTRYTRVEEFVQDTWKVSERLHLNLGFRLSHLWGTIKDVGTVYTASRIAPRVGFTFDLLGDRSTVLKAHYGQFTETIFSALHDRLNPADAYSDWIEYYWDVFGLEWVEYYREVHEELYEIADDIKHPYMNQFTVSIERELFKDASFSVSLIYRDWKNIIGTYNTLAQYQEGTVNDPETGSPYTVYVQTNVGQNHYVIANLKEGDPWILDKPYRRYWGLEFLFNKRFSDKWQLLASYVYGQAKGTLDNNWMDDLGRGGYRYRNIHDPNYWLNADGNSTNDNTHMLKIQGTYVLPFGIYLTGYFRAITGDSWTRRYYFRLPQGMEIIFTEPRGSNHYPIRKIFDMRLEKTFMIAEKYRLGLMLDIFNLFNDDTITSWGTRTDYDWLIPTDPDYYSSTSGHKLYGIVRPRQARVGIRLMF